MRIWFPVKRCWLRPRQRGEHLRWNWNMLATKSTWKSAGGRRPRPSMRSWSVHSRTSFFFFPLLLFHLQFTVCFVHSRICVHLIRNVSSNWSVSCLFLRTMATVSCWTRSSDQRWHSSALTPRQLRLQKTAWTPVEGQSQRSNSPFDTCGCVHWPCTYFFCGSTWQLNVCINTVV